MQNRISTMHNKDGVIVKDFDQVKSIVIDFYKELFATPQEDTSIAATLNKFISDNIEDSDRSFLDQPFTAEEIEGAMLGMKLGETPGPDGFPLEFYKATWSTVREFVVEAVKTFFATCSMPRYFNSTIIALIPKKQEPVHITFLAAIPYINV
ncbi:hypothetical protein LIER_08763 [Lithospermum erythrorhizon]|uniref:Uncharacterized protein n=1 Tax=Lithospermum erythrorhizon TaxID=34254 RepID=A0AAV3PDC0_LITER